MIIYNYLTTMSNDIIAGGINQTRRRHYRAQMSFNVDDW